MNCIHHITLTISEMASTVSVSSQRLYSWSQTNFMYDIIPTLRMPSFALYTTLNPLFMTSHHCIYHIYPLHSWHHTPYIWHHTHGHRNVISAIWPTISNTTFTVSVSSNSRYQLYHTHSLYDITHYTCDIIIIIHAITANIYDIIPLYV